jgi:hypothetical protein
MNNFFNYFFGIVEEEFNKIYIVSNTLDDMDYFNCFERR